MRWFKKDKNQALPWPYTYELRAKLEIEVLRKFFELVSQQKKEQEIHLGQLYRQSANDMPESSEDLEEDLEGLCDEFWMLDLAENQAQRLAIVGLYRIVELCTRNMFLWIYYGQEEKLKSLHRWKSQKLRLREDFEYDLQTTRDYAAVDELRCLNNVIKHNDGIVDAELAGFPNWKKAEEIKNLWEAFERLAPSVPVYVKDLAEKLNERRIRNAESDRA